MALEHRLQDRYHVRFGGGVSRSKDAIQLLQAYPNRSSTHDTNVRRLRREVRNNPHLEDSGEDSGYEDRVEMQAGVSVQRHVLLNGRS